MNLLSVTRSIILDHEVFKLPIEELVKKINERPDFQKPDKTLVSIDELTNLIMKFGSKNNLKVDANGIVAITVRAER